MQSGKYLYFLNGKPTGVTETFETTHNNDGTVSTISTRDAAVYGTKINVETLEEAGRLLNCKIIFDSDKSRVAATYEIIDRSLNFTRSINDERSEIETFTLPNYVIFFPLMRVFQGRTIAQIAKVGSVSTVIVPDIRNPNDVDKLLKPTFDERIAELMSEHDNIRVFRYLSSRYDDNSEFHLDTNDMLVYYKFVQTEDQIWEVTLEFPI